MNNWKTVQEFINQQSKMNESLIEVDQSLLERIEKLENTVERLKPKIQTTI